MTVLEKALEDGGVNVCINGKSYAFKKAKEVMEFLNKTYKEEILDDVEKRYLRNIVRPFYDKVISVRKNNYYSGNDEEYIVIDVCDDSAIILPNFKKGSMYTGMKCERDYTLEELGIEK